MIENYNDKILRLHKEAAEALSDERPAVREAARIAKAKLPTPVTYLERSQPEERE